MARVKRGVRAHERHKKILKLARGYRGRKSKLFRMAKQQVVKSMAYAYVHRKQRRRDFRKLWITRINAAARMNNITYNRLMYGLKLANVNINRKMLADLAVNDAAAFTKLVEVAQSKLDNTNAKAQANA
ncbi:MULTISPECIES: 50S ribosomal protein L20 [Dehalobacter]|jgi:large subunit ribosomal protein L20|uniref:Large ribosomal subunit protein bL20 n=2 Tax=Dehalobacter restrictus TaxID=55583 RepID=A0A857DGT7_9FIRM|nr:MULTISPECIES: 50S ribosomal protein L20 [Dehalobacter]AFV03003.1 LSU ribosomal protein L20p [Dehalobacter sp. DCA]AFV05992.1 LSU ribosomal protein L20p [Dehalobacter sp. CF]AHF08976.1 50S ribosomal protein L20 [Dehalobacter restrictus DSM 9455]EQB20142.1 LSU ribosomal protein L20p [Dehalobacter sp. UNSWDHB]MCG1025510.1 50S ribosomal protein L20 [Dehalobacter sp.]